MIELSHTLTAYGTPDFSARLKLALEQLGNDDLPLQQGLRSGNVARDDKLGAMIIQVEEAKRVITVRAGLFYTSIIAGCACADDPTPVDENTEYCEVLLHIDRDTGQTSVRLADG